MLLTCLCLLFVSGQVLFVFVMSVDETLFELVAFEAGSLALNGKLGITLDLIVYKLNQTAVHALTCSSLG